MIASVEDVLKKSLNNSIKQLTEIGNLFKWTASIKNNLQEIAGKNPYVKKHLEDVMADPKMYPPFVEVLKQFLEPLKIQKNED